MYKSPVSNLVLNPVFKAVGWDIGGAHLKAVLLTENSLQGIQIPCELWRGLDKLETAMNKALRTLGVAEHGVQHAVTMTGELVDLFANRREGVIAISHCVSKLLGEHTHFYAANLGFMPAERIAAHATAIASANWHASASLIAKHVKNALFVDIGSTTTDIVPIMNGQVALSACTDAQRMATDTLIYTGAVRTPLMALAQKLRFNGDEINVAAEYFATMADVYRLTGDLQAAHDMAETADGKGKTALESARRLARMVGHDVEDLPLEEWKMLAETCKNIQLLQIKSAALKHLPPDSSVSIAPIIGAGAGAFLAKGLAESIGRPYLTVADALKIALNDDLSVCFPAFAVARLAELEAQ